MKPQPRKPASSPRRRAARTDRLRTLTPPPGPGAREALVLAAETPQEFIELLRRIQEASGLTSGQIAAYTGIPRSTAYHFISPKNTALPSNSDQVEQFLRGCRLTDDQIRTVMQIWTKLGGLPNPPSPPDHDDGAVAVQPSPWAKTAVSGVRSGLVPLVTVDRANFQPSLETYFLEKMGVRLPESPSDLAVPTIERRGGAINVVYRVGDQHGAFSAKTLPRTGRFRRDVLVLLVIALYPVAATMFLGPPRTATMYTVFFGLALVGLLVGVFPWWGRLPTVSPERYTVATVLGAGAGTLTWAAVGLPFIGLLTGFLVFAAAPMWFATMEAAWTVPFTSSRAVVTVLVATWFGIIAGGLVVTTGGAIAGAILTGALSTAAVLMETAARTMPLANTTPGATT